jgi:Family of unknown function (DUF6353)
MNLEAAKAFVQNKTARQVLLTQKHSPKILFVAGAVGVVTATVLACRATLKMNDVLDEAEIRTNTEKQVHAQTAGAAYSDELLAKSLRTIQIQTALGIAKLYALPVGIGLVSITALAGSHVILTKRNGALMATYASLDQAYKKYRQNVVTEYGVEADQKMAFNAEPVTVEEKLADGTTKITSKNVAGKTGLSPYAALFDPTTSGKFSREPGMNSMILGIQQSHANNLLRAQGHLFLNEVHDMLQLPRTKAGAVVGWVWRRENEEKTGDNYVSFGVFDHDVVAGKDFVSGNEDSVWLDFNVDGVILDLI